MPLHVFFSIIAATLSLIIAAVVLLRDSDSWVHRMLAAGMYLFATQELLRGLISSNALVDNVIYWHKWILAIEALNPAIWLAFSISYARSNPVILTPRA